MQIVIREMRNTSAPVSIYSFCERMIDERAELAGVEPMTGHSVSVAGSSLIPGGYTQGE
jgi:hypothetical protein